MEITPLFGRILLREIKKTPRSSIIHTSDEPNSDRGIVIESGESQNLKIGDIVIFNIRFARYLKVDDTEIISIDEKDILAIIDF